MSVAPYFFTDIAEHAHRSPHAPPAPLLQPVRLPVTEPPFDDEIGLSAAAPIARYGRAADPSTAMAQPDGFREPHRPARPTAPTLAHGSASSLVSALASPMVRPARAPSAPPPSTLSASSVSSPSTLSSSPSTLTPPAVGTPPTLRLLPGGRVRPVAPPVPEVPEFGPGALVRIGGPTADRTEQPEDARLAMLPDPRPLAGQVAQAVVEVLAGDRPLSQLLTWLDERIYTELAALAPKPPTSPAGGRARASVIRPQDRPKVRSVHVTRPAPGVAEVAARVQTNGRSRAVALRLEEWRGRWRCCALVVG